MYHAQINVDQYPMETAFWDVVASVDKEGKGNYEDAILGGLSSKLKLNADPFSKMDQNRGWAYGLSLCQRSKAVYHSITGNMIPKYDSYAFIAKEFLALFCYFILKPYWDHKKLWLICEKYCTMAQDNGLYFFRYCMEHAPEKDRSRIFM